MTSSLLSVKDLTVQVATPTGPKVVVERLSFDLLPGRTLCLAGESGSGKSMTALSLMQLLPKPMARIAGGSANLDGEDILALPEARMRRIRGRKIGMIFQEPMTSLNPVMTVGNQLIGAITAHGNTSGRRAARARAVELLDQVQIPEPERRLGQYPHELSGGLRQRIVIAMALAQNPKILIADEPTTALDVTVQAQVLALIRKLQADHGISVIMITHDMGVVAEMADEVLVMKHGRTVEHATSRDLFAHPQDAYTKELLSAVPRLGEMAGTETPKRAAGKAVETGSEPGAEQPMLQAENLTVRFDIKGGILQRPIRRLHAVEGISFSVRRGETGITASIKSLAQANVIAAGGEENQAPMIWSGGMAWIADFPDPSNFYGPILGCGGAVPGGWNWSWYCNEELDKKAAEADAIVDPAKAAEREALWRDIYLKIMEDAPWAPIFNEERFTIRSERIGGDDKLFVDPVHIPVHYDQVYAKDVQ
ncbi:ATP-binding cassette domain-containing protein [Sinorhizobium meliloti]|uniref:ATP-binding cassette domain-containing protein n=1 Tax=Rhizobium meliloti TaxID=382 RepID=UPI001F2F8746|nr:ATP-binding cassette domain-containing protein [Sinorhizobium meliloti]